MRRWQGPSGAPAAAGPAQARFEGTMAWTGNADDKATTESRTGTRRRRILRTGAEDDTCGGSRCPIAPCSARWNLTCSSARSKVFPKGKTRRSGRQSERHRGLDQGPTAVSGFRTSVVALLRSLTMRLTFRAVEVVRRTLYRCAGRAGGVAYGASRGDCGRALDTTGAARQASRVVAQMTPARGRDAAARAGQHGALEELSGPLAQGG